MIPLGLIAFGKSWWKAGLGLIVGAALCFPLAQCDGRRQGRQAAALELSRANTRYLQQKAKADELAADQRITDTIAVNRQEEELRDAIAATPDERPDAVRIRLGCERLRQAGRDTSSIAACR